MRRQMEVTSAWTGEKKTKIQSTPTSACGDIGEAEEDDASAMIIVQEGPEQLEGLDWDQDTLDEKIDWYLQLQQLNRRLPDNDDDDFWVHCDDKQRREMNQRLALCRIRAHMVGICYHQSVRYSDGVTRSYKFIHFFILVWSICSGIYLVCFIYVPYICR